jgi:FG-GAP-like repeat/FG-GAP repeat
MRCHVVAVLIAGALLTPSAPAFAQFVQQGPKLVGTGGVGAGWQGAAVALSADGNTAIVGGPLDDSLRGAAWVFTRSNGVWTQQGAKLVGTGAIPCCIGKGNQGTAVAISADGNTAIIGGSTDNNGAGAAWIFVRSGGVWTQEGPKLVGTGASGTASGQGGSVALSADGNTALVGGGNDGFGVTGAMGATWVFVRTGSTWTQQGSKLVGTGATGVASQGASVALSADGNTAFIGGPSDNSDIGAAWVFIRSGSTWTQQGGKVTPADAARFPHFGSAVALSGDGNTAAIGGPFENTGPFGAVWVFTRSGSTWAQQGSKLVGTGAEGTLGYQGSSVSLSGDGNVLFEGAPRDGDYKGAAWAFVRNGTTWTQAGNKLMGTGSVGSGPDGPQQGASVALSSNGLTAIVGGPHDNAGAGAAWIFSRPLYAAGDVDGDRRADVTVYRSNGDWATLTSGSSYASSIVGTWGGPDYTPVPGDYDGDGKQDIAVYRKSTGVWSIMKSSTNYTTVLTISGGNFYAKPMPGDYDGDGKTDVAAYQPSAGVWAILTSSSGYASGFNLTWGGTGYVAIGGQDFDGDGKADIGVYKPATLTWSILKSSSNYTTVFSTLWGSSGCMLVPGDYDGDGKADPAFYQPSLGGWFALSSSSNYTTTIGMFFGVGGYLPVPADYDGDGVTDIALFQRSTGNWTILQSSLPLAPALTIPGWGGPTDVPVSSAIPTTTSDTMRASDFDGDGKADITIYQESTATWSTLKSTTSYTASTIGNWGGPGYTLAPGDYDGDGKTDLGVYQQASGNWYVLLSGQGFMTAMSTTAGGPGWVAVPGDYDGDGRTDFGVYNTTTGLWYALLSGSEYTTSLSVTWGGPQYAPTPGDFDGDGKTDLGLYVKATGDWYVLLSFENYTTSRHQTVGGPTYDAAQSDYDADGKTDFGVYDPTTGLWYALLSGANYTTTLSVVWGGPSYTPVRGDFDGDGRQDLALYQSSSNSWYVLLSGANYTTSLVRQWGGAGYVPLPTFP